MTSSFHQAVPEIEADEDEEEKLVSNYPFFTSPYTDDTSVPNTRLITTKCQDISSYNETIDTVTSRTNTSTPQFVQYKTQQYLSSSVIDDNPSNPISNKPYDSHISAPNVSPISQSGIELTDLKTELHNVSKRFLVVIYDEKNVSLRRTIMLTSHFPHFSYPFVYMTR